MRGIRRWGRDFAASAWHDPSKLTPAIWEGYQEPLQAENWDQGLWELTIASRDLHLPAHLHEVSLPILVLTGDDDRIVPTSDSLRLAGELPNASLAVLPNCGHVPQEECPGPFLTEVERYLNGFEPTR
jgi:pimeloyl-ACP methyl ester carboxylesterase